jgi:TolB-like protein
VIRIGPFELDLDQRRISRDGEAAVLSPRAWGVLEQLVRNRGRLVSTHDLLADQWQGRASDETYVRKIISEIRRVLGDSAQSPVYIRTVPKLGYLLTSEVPAPADNMQPAGATRTIAVLPFANFSDDRTLDHFCNGLTEEVLNRLSHDAQVPVVARTSSFQFKDRNLDIREIGKLLDADLILEGSVRTHSGMIRVTAQLIDAQTGFHRWSEHYDCPRSNDISTQDSIALAITARVWGAPPGGELPPRTVIFSERFTSPDDFKRLRTAIEASKIHTPR